MRFLVAVMVVAACAAPRVIEQPRPEERTKTKSKSKSKSKTKIESKIEIVVVEEEALNLEEIDPSLLGETEDGAAIEPVIGRAQASLEAGQWDKAIAQARAALAIDADEARAIAVLAKAFRGKGAWDSAQAALEQGMAGRKAAGSSELWHLAGQASFHLGDSERALRELEQAVKLKKDDAVAWNLLGVVHLARGEAAEAVQALETARSHAADSIGILTNLGSAYRRAAAAATMRDEVDGLLRKAEASYQAALGAGLGRGEGVEEATLGLGLLYLDAGNFPGIDDVTRLENAVHYLSQLDSADVDRHLADARRDLDRARKKRR